MSFLWAALLLGLAGSLHCIGMCGPLVMAVHSAKSSGKWWWQKAIYHLGRISVYATFGFIAGLVGKSFAAFGFQQALSIVAGLLMLLFIAFPMGWKGLRNRPMKAVSWLKSKFGELLQKRSATTHFFLGAINGLLPCGLVYVTLSAALAVGSPGKSALFMAIFGMGTVPALFAAGSLVKWIGSKLRLTSYRGVQVTLALLSLLIILRGANLGIPYISPKMVVEKKEVKLDCCHKGKKCD